MPLPHHLNWDLYAGPAAVPGPVLSPGYVLVLAIWPWGWGEGPVPGICASQFGAAPEKQAGLSGGGRGWLPLLLYRCQRRQTTGNYGLICSWTSLRGSWYYKFWHTHKLQTVTTFCAQAAPELKCIVPHQLLILSLIYCMGCCNIWYLATSGTPHPGCAVDEIIYGFILNKVDIPCSTPAC